MDRARKRELRALNERAWDGEKDLILLSKSLDSSMKKNTAFIKRLRTAISPGTLNTFIQEIRSVSLTKYLSEIVSACYEGLTKLKTPAEVEAGAEIVSALHQRFGPQEFTEYLGWQLGRGMATPDRSLLKTLAPDARDKEEKDRLVRQRVLLRVITELWLLGVLRTLDDVARPEDAAAGGSGSNGIVAAGTAKTAPGKGSDAGGVRARNGGGGSSSKGGGAEPFPLEVLKDLLGHDREHANLPLLVTFVKSFSWDVLAVRSAGSATTERKTVEEDGATKSAADDSVGDAAKSNDVDPPFCGPELQERFRNVLKRYFEDVKGHLVRDQKSISNQARRNAEAYVKSGEVFEDRQANFEKQVKAQERLVANAQVIADVIGQEMPELKDENDSTAATNGSIGLVRTGDYLRGQGDKSGIWEDEEERRFYENLVDLKGKVPGILLEEVKKKKADDTEQVGKKIDPSEAAAAEAAKAAADPAEDQSTAIANKTIGAQVDAIIARLPDLTNKDMIDETAIAFCFLNSKASRNRLIKALQDVPKGRNDLLPSWARLVATLGRYMPDVPKALVEHLDAEFRSLQRRKEKEFLGQVRLSNIRYLAELTKFGIVPEHVVFHCLKVSLDDFSRMNIEIICNLLENCGRYLLRTPETAPRMASFLETLQRKKSVQHIGQQERMLIENAVYYVDPPERPAIEQKERTPTELYIRKLIYVDMSKRNYSKILKQIRKLHWEEPEVRAILFSVFSKPYKVKFGSIHLICILLSALYRYHTEFVVRVIDTVMENMAQGLELNDFKYYQKRIGEVKFLGELYNYRMVENPAIFDIMWKILTFGYSGPPMPGRYNSFDPPDDFFRIRLIATMLDVTGGYFKTGPVAKKLDYFLSFFQYYIYTKNPLPMDIEFIVQDIFALTRPDWRIASSYEEASKAFQLAVAQDQKSMGIDKAGEEELSSGSTSDDDEDLPLAEADGGDEVGSDEEDAEDVDAQNSSQEADSDAEEDEEIVVTRKEEYIDPEEEADFEREYAKMMAESLESRKFDRKPLFDVPLPVRSKTRENTMTTEAEDGAAASPSSTMSFSLLTKKGNRQQTRTVELPSDSTFAVAMKTTQQAAKEEQQRIKNLVLTYDLRESEEQESEDRMPPLPVNQNIYSNKSGNEKPSYHHNRAERQAKDKGGQRVRKLQLSDVVDWYGTSKQNNNSRSAKVLASKERGLPQPPQVEGGKNKCPAPPAERAKGGEGRPRFPPKNNKRP